MHTTYSDGKLTPEELVAKVKEAGLTYMAITDHDTVEGISHLYENYHEILAEADACKDELSVLRKKHIDRIQHLSDNSLMQISLVYLNVLQESQEFLSVMRHQLRAAKKFMEK